MSVTTGIGALSEREKQVLALIAQGRTNPEIAAELGIRFDTAKWHVSEIITKLGVENREEAVREWRRQQSPAVRLIRGLRVLAAPFVLHKTVAVIVAGALVVAGGGLVVAANLFAGNSAQPLSLSSRYGQIVDQPLFFRQLRMMDSTTGWGSTDLPGATPSGAVGGATSLIRTDNGGRTWRDVSPAVPSGTIQVASFLDSLHSWVLIDHPTTGTNTRSASVAWTVDGGRSWEERSVPGAELAAVNPQQASTLSELMFVDPSHGWLVVRPAGVIFSTSDGGRSWRRVSVLAGTNAKPVAGKLPASCGQLLVKFVDSRVGFASGECGDGAPFLFRSGDAGASWTRVTMPAPGTATENATQGFAGVPSFPTPKDGYLALFVPKPGSAPLSSQPGSSWVSTPTMRTLYVTDDGGLTWSPIPGSTQPTVGIAGGVEFVDVLHGWYLDSEQFSRATDGGLTWQQLPKPPGGFNFLSPTEAFGFGSVDGQPKVIHTTDGGETWQAVNP